MAIKPPEWLRSKELDEVGREKVSVWKVALLALALIAVVAFIVAIITDMKSEKKEKPIEKVEKSWEEPDFGFDKEIEKRFVEEPSYTPTETVKEDKKEETKKEEKKEPDPRIGLLARLGKERFEPFKMDLDKVSGVQEFAGANGVGGGCNILPGTTAKLGLEKAVNTDNGGVVTAILMEPIPGPDGCIAVAMGARFTGVVDPGVAFGQSRANVAFTSITTTDSRVINIEDQAGDAVGTGGVPGKVNRHWGSKIFGVAISTAVDLTGYALSGNGNDGYNIMLGESSSVMDDFARQFVNRKDTITVDPTQNRQVITVTFSKEIKT